MGGAWGEERKGRELSGSPGTPAMLGSWLRASRAMGSSHRVSAISWSALGEQGRQGGRRSGPGRVLTGLEPCVPPQLGARPDPCHPLALVNLPCRLCLLWACGGNVTWELPSQACVPRHSAHFWGEPESGPDAWASAWHLRQSRPLTLSVPWCDLEGDALKASEDMGRAPRAGPW